MADFLTAIKSVRSADGSRTQDQDDLLRETGSKSLRHRERPNNGSQLSPQPSDPTTGDARHVKSNNDALGANRETTGVPNDDSDEHSGSAANAREALHTLRSQPSLNTLLALVKQLNCGNFDEPFSLAVPGPLQAQIISTLLNDVVPTFWLTLETKHQDLLLSLFQNVAGLNAVVARLRLLASRKSCSEDLADTVDVASKLLARDDLLASIQQTLRDRDSADRKHELVWKELINVVGSGKIIGAVAQAEDVLKAGSSSAITTSWLVKSSSYSAWLGRSVAQIVVSADPAEDQHAAKDASLLVPKALQLGHPGQFFDALLSNRKSHGQLSGGQLSTMAQSLPAHGKQMLIEALLKWTSSAILPETTTSKPELPRAISATSGLLATILKGHESLLESFISDPALSISLSLPIRRACMAVLDQQSEDSLQSLLEKLIATFSSTLFIAHAAVLQQECVAQCILIASGYVHRRAPMSLLITARSSGHMQGVSNRLDSSNPRARWLGMVVGTALSKLVDKRGSQMDFGTEEIKSAEAAWYQSLATVEDGVGTFEEFQALLESRQQLQRPAKPLSIARTQTLTLNGKPVFGPPRPPAPAQTAIVGDRVTEIQDGDSESDGDLKPYAKPDSDPEDSDEDATLVNRNKARAPVYVRDLMAGLRDDKNFDRFNLAIKNAPKLIRRKTGFGKEVKDHAEELAGMLCNLQDPFDINDFDDMRLQALVALLLSDVNVIAPFLVRQAFAEGYSIAQRCVMLSALGLAGRELAGFRVEDEEYNPKLANTDFPSKRLPQRLHAIYSSAQPAPSQTKRLEAASKSIEHQMIQPMALQAADQSTAHLNAVKVRTFSSRMDVEKARVKRKPPANELANCFAERFFFPLANRYQQEMAAYGSGSVYNSAAFVLTTFIKTLALLLHASGPATLGLPQISAEMWDLLLSLRTQATGDISIMQAVLFALLTLLEVNTDKQRIVQDNPKQLMETQQWVDLVFERAGGGGLVEEDGKGEEAKVRTLAAGVLMKCRDIIEAYQKQLVGFDLQ